MVTFLTCTIWKSDAVHCIVNGEPELKMQFPEWPQGSSTTHCSTGAVKYSCRKTRPHCSTMQQQQVKLLPPSANLCSTALFPCPFLPRFLYHVIFLSSYITAPSLVSISFPVFLPLPFCFTLFCLLHHPLLACLCVTWTYTVTHALGGDVMLWIRPVCSLHWYLSHRLLH